MEYIRYNSPIGPLLLCSDGTALKSLSVCAQLPQPAGEDEILARTKLWLDRYFRGEVPVTDIPLDPEGTPFQKAVWQHLLAIPQGKTLTYGELARQISPAMSAQAVGQAVGRNPIAILIPCHRVVGRGGTMTGYAWGIEKKKWLLDHEAGRNHHAVCGISRT